METKMITLPFEVELAKKIQAGELPGKIVTEDGNDARIVCWDMRKENFPIVAVIGYDGEEKVYEYTENGCFYFNGIYEETRNLVIQTSEWSQYKEGDVLEFEDGSIVIFDEFEKRAEGTRISFFAALKHGYELVFPIKKSDYFGSLCEISGYATKGEKRYFIDALKQSTDSRAKEYLKRFFGIEEKEVPEQKLDFLQPVLVRGHSSNQWRYGNFTHMSGGLHFVSGGIGYKYCIPYTEQTKHLLGTTYNWEEQQ